MTTVIAVEEMDVGPTAMMTRTYLKLKNTNIKRAAGVCPRLIAAVGDLLNDVVQATTMVTTTSYQRRRIVINEKVEAVLVDLHLAGPVRQEVVDA